MVDRHVWRAFSFGRFARCTSLFPPPWICARPSDRPNPSPEAPSPTIYIFARSRSAKSPHYRRDRRVSARCHRPPLSLLDLPEARQTPAEGGRKPTGSLTRANHQPDAPHHRRLRSLGVLQTGRPSTNTHAHIPCQHPTHYDSLGKPCTSSAKHTVTRSSLPMSSPQQLRAPPATHFFYFPVEERKFWGCHKREGRRR